MPAAKLFIKHKLNSSGFGHILVLLMVVIGVAVIGTYLLVSSNASPPQTLNSNVPPDNPARGLYYQALQRASATGPCAGEFVPASVDAQKGIVCTHPDPGPEGVDLRERVKKVDAELQAEVDFDKAHPPVDNPDPNATPVTASAPSDNTGSYATSLSNAPTHNWPCPAAGASGTTGKRIHYIYAYLSGHSSAANRSYIEAIAKRIEGIAYYSGITAGQWQLYRFTTGALRSDGTCALGISVIQISSSNVNSFDNIVSQVKKLGYNSGDRKYLIAVDGGTACGYGYKVSDERHSLSNYNNGNPYNLQHSDGSITSETGASWAVVWKPCWNYAEPHELMHSMGSVFTDAPYATKGSHCYDQHDVMCYNDGSGKAMITRCSATANIWRYDCAKDTYFDSYQATGWLSTHWNTADSSFFTP